MLRENTHTNMWSPEVTQQKECKMKKMKIMKDYQEGFELCTWVSWEGKGWSDAPMLTDSRLAQCPHLTVTMVSKLLHGTLTCQNPFSNAKGKQILSLSISLGII